MVLAIHGIELHGMALVCHGILLNVIVWYVMVLLWHRHSMVLAWYGIEWHGMVLVYHATSLYGMVLVCHAILLYGMLWYCYGIGISWYWHGMV